MTALFSRGGAAALLLTGLAGAAAAQGGGGGVRRDSVILRIIDPTVRARLDSIKVLMRAFDEAPAASEASVRIRQSIESLTVSMWRMQPGIWVDSGPGRKGHGEGRLFLKEFDGPGGFDRQFRRTGWIGITTDGATIREQVLPSGHFVQYFSHPIIASVERNSPAQQAGIVPGDSLIAYDGVDVVGRMLNLTEMLVPGRKLGITVRRSGDNKEYSVTVGRAPVRVIARMAPDDWPPDGSMPPRIIEGGPLGGGPPPGGKPGLGFGAPDGDAGRFPKGPRTFLLTGSGAFGASMTTFESAIAEKLNLPAGVLVKDVPESTIAAKAGLMPADVIIAVAGHTVTTLPELQMLSMANGANHSVVLTVVRDKKKQQITVVWPAAPDRP